MASYEDFGSDTDDELLQDVIALPVHHEEKEFFLPSQNQSSIVKQKEIEQSAIHDHCSQQRINKDFSDVLFSSDGFLSDICRGQQCSLIQEAWIAGGMGGQQVKQLIHKLFSSSQNSHLSAIYLMYHSYDFFKNKTNSLAFFVVDQFEIWLDEFHKVNGFYPAVEKQITKEAVVAISRQKNGKVLRKVVKMYHGVHYNTYLIPAVQVLVEQQEFASACRLAVALHLFCQFKKEDFVLPLIVQDRLPLAEEYLKNDSIMQSDVVSFLDNHMKQPYEMLKLISKSSIPAVNYEKLTTKNVASLVTRLAKRFNLDKKLHPEAILRQKIGNLRYLIHKKYNENSIDEENWAELVELAVSDSIDLQVELIEQLTCIDREAATRYAKIYAVPEERLPFNCLPVAELKDDGQTQFITMPLMEGIVHSELRPQFYTLSIPFDAIHWICSWKDVKQFVEIVSKASVVGIDVEWQPSFDAQLPRAAILQVATHNQIFILDVFSLREERECTAAESQQLIRIIFGNPHILKLGFGMKEDLQVLSRSLPGLGDVSKAIINWVDIKNLWSHIETRHPSFISTVVLDEDILRRRQNTHKGLSGLINLLFGLPLDKKEQISDWQRRPLRRSQLTYAALDAFCLLQVYDYLQERARVLEINWGVLMKKFDTAHAS